MNTLWLSFLTGITTGGISCLAVQGGLLASALAPNQKETISDREKYNYVASFLASKLFAYTILGGALGALGSAVTLSPITQGWMQIFAGLFMLLTAARLLDLHPFFRYFVIQPPRFAYKLLKNQTKNTSLFAPLLLGSFTVFIPCGVTQAMMLMAIASGSALSGALTLFGFTLGTIPVFAGIGVTALELMKKKSFAYVATSVVALLGILSINTGQILRGSNHTLGNYIKAAGIGDNEKAVALAKVTNEGVQEVYVDVRSDGYETSINTLKLGVPVKMHVRGNNVKSCARSFTIPTLNISKIIPQDGEEIIEFTPRKLGRLAYTCSMGMFGGAFTVIQ